MKRPRIRIGIFLTMAIVVAIPVVVLSLMLAILSARSESLRGLDRFRYAQSYLAALIEDRNRQVIARTMLASVDPRLQEALTDSQEPHKELLILAAEYGLDGYVIGSPQDTRSLQLLDHSINTASLGNLSLPEPVVGPSAILLFHTEYLESSGYQFTGVVTIKRGELEVLRAGIGAELDILRRNDPLGTRILTTNRDSFGRNLAGSGAEPALSPGLAEYPGQNQSLGAERRYTNELAQERVSRLMTLATVMDTQYIASISFPLSRTTFSEVAAYLIASTLITILLAALASQLLSRQIVDPIQSLLQGINNFTVDIDANEEFLPLPLASRNEIGELTEAFNRMGVRLQNAYLSLTSRNEALKALDVLKDQFLATTSKELRAPLNAIINLADSMLGSAAPQSLQYKNLQSITNTGRRLHGMVNDILDYTRLEHSDIELATRTFDLRPLVDNVLRFCSSIKRPETELRNLVEPGRQIHCDESRLEQVLYKLVGRAIKNTAAGTISVRSWEEDSILHISVAGSGEGINVRPAGIPGEAWAGVGLSPQTQAQDLDLGIAVRLVRLHGGELEVLNDADRTVVIRLPAQVPTATGPAPGGLPLS